MASCHNFSNYTQHTTQAEDTYVHTQVHTKPKHKSPSTISRSWRRAIAWRRQMGLLPQVYTDSTDLPSLVACDAVQQRYLQTTEYIDQMCFQGAMDYEAAKHLKRDMFAWATLQTCLMVRIEELEVDNIEYENELRRLDRQDKTKTQDKTKSCQSTESDHGAPNLRKYDAKKSETYIKPVNFISAGFINKQNDTPHTKHTQHRLELNLSFIQNIHEDPAVECK